MNELWKCFFEILGRASIVIMILNLMEEVFNESLYYNWWFFIGGLLIVLWICLPSVNRGKKDE